MISEGLRDMFLIATLLHLDAGHDGTLLACQDNDCYEIALDLLDLVAKEQQLNRIRAEVKVA